MNAFTASDFTCYPAASQVPKDFYNLLEVYLDAVFKPSLDKLSFLQEGWRLDFDEDKLVYKGIVFNEMKGALTNPNSRLHEAMMAALCPDLTYGINSGGEPLEIPNLTYEGLLDFHRTYYHPSRCIFFFYGNLPIEGHLEFIDRHVLSAAEQLPAVAPIPPQKRFTQPVRVSQPYPFSAEDDPKERAMMALTWLCSSILDQERVLALQLIEMILMGTDAAPLKRALLESGLCKQAGSYVDGEMSEVPFVLILKGCEPANTQALEGVVLNCLQKTVNEGFSQQLVEGAIHQLELSRREITGDHYPFGISLFMRAVPLMQHGGEIEDSLRIDSLFKQLREKVKDPSYLSNILQEELIENSHRVSATL